MHVPTCRFYLDVLTNHVETEVLSLLNIITQSLISRCGIKTVRPPALVERTELEERLVVQFQTYDAIFITATGELTHGSIAIHFVHYLTFINKGHLQCIEERTVRTPKFHVLRHFHIHLFTIDTLARCHQLIAIVHTHFQHIGSSTFRYTSIYLQYISVHIRQNTKIRNMLFIDRLQPYGLPNARNRRIPNTARLAHLLTSWLIALVGRIPNAHHQFVRLGNQCRSNVERERCITTRVTTYLHIVYPHIGLPIHGTKMKQHLLTLPRRWNLEGTLIHQFLSIIDALLHTRE